MKVREALHPYVSASRKTTRNSNSRGTRSRGTSSHPDTAEIRVWAKENGHQASDRGWIHQSVKAAYYAGH